MILQAKAETQLDWKGETMNTQNKLFTNMVVIVNCFLAFILCAFIIIVEGMDLNQNFPAFYDSIGFLFVYIKYFALANLVCAVVLLLNQFLNKNYR